MDLQAIILRCKGPAGPRSFHDIMWGIGSDSYDPESGGSKRDFVISRYGRYIRFKFLFMAICVIVAICMSLYALTIGGYHIEFAETYRILADHIRGDICDPTKDLIVWDTRLPRVITGIVVGVALASAGAVMQSVMKNPLADPYTTGISSGASFGATLAMTMGVTVAGSSAGLIANAFVFSLIPAAIIILVSGMKGATPTVMILSGIAVMYVFNAFTTLFMLLADPEDLAAVYSWQVGSLGRSSWDYVPVMTVVTALGVLVLQFLAGKINVLTTGDDNAKSLGIDAGKLRIFCLIVVSLVTASVVSFTGIIGFVGLVCPHVVRIFLGSDNRYLIPASALFGVVLVLVSDVVGRTLLYPTVLQVGVVTAFIGGPMFLYLITKANRRALRWRLMSSIWNSPMGWGRGSSKTYLSASRMPA